MISSRVLQLKVIKIVSRRFVSRCGWKRLFRSGAGTLFSTAIPLSINNLHQVPVTPTIRTAIVQRQHVRHVKGVMFILMTLYRLVRYIVIFGPVLVLYPLTVMDYYSFQSWTRLLLSAIQRAGPVAMKLGQWAATRRDLFSPVTCDMLSQLHRKTDPHPWSHTEKVLAEDLGKDVLQVFKEIDKTPVGSGCVAQVYKATLKDNNRPGRERVADCFDVAVKVLHPGIEQQFRTDIAIMKFGARFLNSIYWPLKWLDLPRCVDEFEKIMLGQIDMRSEAENMARFGRNFSEANNVEFPRPIWDLVTERVLVETFEDGIPIERFCSSHLAENLSLRKNLADIGANLLLKMDGWLLNKLSLSNRLTEYNMVSEVGSKKEYKLVFQDNFVHGDLHPGNLLVRYPGGNPSENAYLVVLDCGIVTELRPKDLRDFRDTFKAIILKQGETVANLFLERSFNQCENPDLFRKEMAALVKKLRGEKLTLGKTKVGEMMQDVFSLMIRHKIRVESQFSSIVLAVAVLEGLGRSLDPDMDLLHIARPYVVQEMASGMFTETKDWLGKFLEDFNYFSPFD